MQNEWCRRTVWVMCIYANLLYNKLGRNRVLSVKAILIFFLPQLMHFNILKTVITLKKHSVLL